MLNGAMREVSTAAQLKTLTQHLKHRKWPEPTTFRNRITANGNSGYPAVADRYHLYVSLACPWAHRTLILRSLRGLKNVISVSVVDAYMTGEGWHFEERNGRSTQARP